MKRLIFSALVLLYLSQASGQTIIVDQRTKDTTIITKKTQVIETYTITPKTVTIEINEVVVKPYIPTTTPPDPVPSGYLSLPVSNPINGSLPSGTVIDGKRFENSPAEGIYLKNSSNITIKGCFFNKAGREAIVLENCTNIRVENCLFNGVTTGVYALSSQTIKVVNNQFVNVRQRSGGGRGQFVQFNGVTGAGNQINNNQGENFPGESDPEDLVSLFKSSGTQASPIEVKNNTFRGGGPSASGGGIMGGDYGGNYQVIENNIVVDPGQYGIAMAGGFNIKLLNNKIIAKQQPFTNNPLYMWAQQGAACGTNTVTGNKVFWINNAGTFNGGWDAGNCPGSTFQYPARWTSYAAALAEVNVPIHLITFITPAELKNIRGIN